MKREMVFVAACSVIFLFFLTASISFAANDLWPKKEGELCWDVYSIPGNLPTGLLRLYVKNTGKNYYLVHGSNLEVNDEPLVNGNAIVYADRIMIHASSSGYDDGEVRGWLGTVRLDRESLNGSFQGVGINWEYTIGEDPKDGFGYVTHDGEQALELTGCPQ